MLMIRKNRDGFWKSYRLRSTDAYILHHDSSYILDTGLVLVKETNSTIQVAAAHAHGNSISYIANTCLDNHLTSYNF
jgi:hypothetical protein